ncbi:MAG: hypothetical protein DRN26_00080 [Thermoplasmata archaeon]|nr:MAG: hypothetical protein DRN26_00080 [Thermoplasmata archaeon]
MKFSLEDYTSYVVISGSHSYGTATTDSDVDIRGWYIPPKKLFLSRSLDFYTINQTYDKADNFPWINQLKRRVIQNPIIDVSLYDFHKFINLATKCNPNIVELLFVDKEDILYMDDLAKLLRRNRKLFLTTRAVHTFSGYAHSQLKRIRTHRSWILHPPSHKPTREEFGLPNYSLIPEDQRQAANKLIDEMARLWLLEKVDIDKEIIERLREDLVQIVAYILHDRGITKAIDEEKVMEIVRWAAAKGYDMSDSYTAVLQQEKKYRAALNHWKQYQTWKANRNPVRAELERKYGYDTKHAMHLIRLLLQAQEILSSGTLTLKDPERARFLQKIRGGKMSYDELVMLADNLDSQLIKRYKEKDYVVPHSPDLEKISTLTAEITEAAFQLQKRGET